MSGDLAAFLAARLGEKEAWARKLIADWEPPAIWHSLGHQMLREAAGGRAILDEHAPYEVREGPGKGTQACGAETDWNDTYSMVTAWPCPTVRHLAAVYSDHPGYQAEWAPTPATRAGS